MISSLFRWVARIFFMKKAKEYVSSYVAKRSKKQGDTRDV
jgi:hypothetical protein